MGESSRMARVLLLCEYPTLCGGEMSMLSTIDSLSRAAVSERRPQLEDRHSRFEFVVAAPANGPLADALGARDVEVVPFEFFDPSLSDGKRRSLGELRDRLRRILDTVRPDLLHANSLSMGRLSGPVAADRGLPSCAHLRDIVNLSRAACNDLNRHRRLLAVSEATRRFHTAAGLDADRTQTLYNGVDLERFTPGRATGRLHRELNLPRGAPLVGTIGQISLRKGTDVLLEVAQRVISHHDSVHFLLIGACHSTKREAREIEDRALAAEREGPLAGRFHFLGVRDDVPRVLRELTLLLHPARQEPLGRVLLEAAASGAPIVATEVGGTAEIFPPKSLCAGSPSAESDSQSAALVAPDRPDVLADEVLSLLGDPARRKRLAEAARRRAAAAFDIRHASSELARIYRELIAEGR